MFFRELSGEWMARIFKALRTDARRSGASVYLNGLLDTDSRKSMHAIAERAQSFEYHRLHHFINSSSGNDGLVWDEMMRYSSDHYGSWPGCLVVEDLIIPKRGDQSVGVAIQSNGLGGRLLNCQVVTSFMLVRGGRAVPVKMRLAEPGNHDHLRQDPANAGVSQRSLLLTNSKALIADIKDIIAKNDGIKTIISNMNQCVDPDYCRILNDLGIEWIIRVPRDEKFMPVRDASKNFSRHTIGVSFAISGFDLSKDRDIMIKPYNRIGSSTNWPLLAGRRFVCEGNNLFWRNNARAIKRMQLVAEIYRDKKREYYVTNAALGGEPHNIAAIMQSYWFSRAAHISMTKRFGLDSFEGRSKVGLHRHLLMSAIAFIYERHAKQDEYDRRRQK